MSLHTKHTNCLLDSGFVCLVVLAEMYHASKLQLYKMVLVPTTKWLISVSHQNYKVHKLREVADITPRVHYKMVHVTTFSNLHFHTLVSLWGGVPPTILWRKSTGGYHTTICSNSISALSTSSLKRCNLEWTSACSSALIPIHWVDPCAPMFNVCNDMLLSSELFIYRICTTVEVYWRYPNYVFIAPGNQSTETNSNRWGP